jgi:hypothetical protein
MTSILEVEQLDTLSSNASSTLTIGGTNTTTIAFGPNVTTTPSSLAMTPAFEVYLSSNQSISNNTHTKIQFDGVRFDTDSCYDNTTNYRFTPTTAGKYFIFAIVEVGLGASEIQFVQASIYKNGSQYKQQQQDHRNNNGLEFSVPIYSILTLNGSTDYVEIYAKGFTTGSNPNIISTVQASSFGAYKVTGA